MFNGFQQLLVGSFNIDPQHAGPILSVTVIVLLWLMYLLITRGVKRYVRRQAFNTVNVQNFLLIWRYAWLAVIVIFALISFSGSLTALGLSAAFVGMILGWSLQAPVTGIAGWLMIILKRPFKIGDRVIISGITGDVTDINLTHIVLNQVGGTVSGEEKSGRGVLVPNATLFQQVIYNYTLETDFILDEVTLVVTFNSNLDEASNILLAAAKDVTRGIMAQTGTQPFVRYEWADWGMRIRLRYQTDAKDRQRISSEILRQVFTGFHANDLVDFCYPHQEIVYRPQKPDILTGLDQQSK